MFFVQFYNEFLNDFRWSPQGSYLATVHSRGIAIWGGPNFQKVARFNHPGVQYIDFSPCEKYLVTFSPNPPKNTEDSNPVIIWEARTGMWYFLGLMKI